MFALEWIETAIYPLSQKPLCLFRNRDNGEGVMIGREIANLMGQRSISKLLVSNDYSVEKIHYFLLQGQDLQEFKRQLQEVAILHYKKVSRLLLVTEAGLMLLLSKHTKEPCMRVGAWLLSQVLPKLRPYRLPLYYQKITSLYLPFSLYILVYQGRMGLLAFQLASILEEPPLDSLLCGCEGYVDKVHLTLWKKGIYLALQKQIPEFLPFENEGVYFLYESGIYRLLHQSAHPHALLLERALEREIFPLFRQIASHWNGLEVDTNTPDAGAEVPQNLLAPYPNSMAEERQRWNILSDSKKLLEEIARLDLKLTSFQDKSEIFWAEQKSHLLHFEEVEKRITESLEGQRRILDSMLDVLQANMDWLRQNLFPEPLAAETESSSLPAEEREFSKEEVPPWEGNSSHTQEQGPQGPTQEQKPSCEKKDSAEQKPEPIPFTVPELHQLTLDLGLYYYDRKTPHQTLVRNLVFALHTKDPKLLREYINEYTVREGHQTKILANGRWYFYTRPRK